MTLNELGHILHDMYHNAPQGERVAMNHLFDVKYAEEITSLGVSCKAMAVAAEINESYGVEISKGVHLAKYVRPR